MKVLGLMLLLASSLMASTEKDYAQLYADELINNFDNLLDQKLLLNDQESILTTELYAQLIAARTYIEAKEHQKERGYIEFNPQKFEKIKAKINHIAKDIKIEIDNNKERSSVIYPSVSSAGNLTGNTYPRGVWSLTYDDGPHASRTEMTVDNVYRSGIKATYFMLTRNAKSLPKVVDAVLDAGNELALHSYTHQNLGSSSRTERELNYEIITAKKDLENLTNRKIKLFRLPYGAGTRNSNLRQKIAGQNMVHVFWNIDTLDWKDKDPNSIVARSLKQMALTPKKSGIILFHDIHSQSVTASNMLVQRMLNDGLKFCTVSEVVSFLNNQEQNCL